MFARPGFARDNRGGTVSASDLPVIHEEPSQFIQGGIPGQHYHLSEALRDALVTIVNGGIYFDVILMSLTGEMMLGSDGDTMLIRQYVPFTPIAA